MRTIPLRRKRRIGGHMARKAEILQSFDQKPPPEGKKPTVIRCTYRLIDNFKTGFKEKY
jgi:hypothetical protein